MITASRNTCSRMVVGEFLNHRCAFPRVAVPLQSHARRGVTLAEDYEPEKLGQVVQTPHHAERKERNKCRTSNLKPRAASSTMLTHRPPHSLLTRNLQTISSPFKSEARLRRARPCPRSV